MLCYYLWFHPTGVQIFVRQVLPGLATSAVSHRQLSYFNAFLNHFSPLRQDSVRAVPEAPMTELVQLSKEPERGGKEQLQPAEDLELDTDSAAGGEEGKTQKLLPQMEKLTLGRSLSAPYSPAQRGQIASRGASAPHTSSSDLSAARKLKYMGQKPTDVV